MINKLCKRIAAAAAALAFVYGGAGTNLADRTAARFDIAASAIGTVFAYGDYEYVPVSSNSVHISKYRGSDSEVVIPASLNGKNVTGINKAAFQGCDITSVTIPDGVTEIGTSAFISCHNLTEVNLPGSLKTISGGAFAYCTSLKSITLPEGLESIGGSSFNGCEGLTEINIPASVTSYESSAFWDCPNIESINVDSENQNYSTFDGAVYNKALTELITCPENRKSISFPESVAKIGDTAFRSCTGFTALEIPGSVTEIGSSAFSGCTGLTEMTVPENVELLDAGAFYKCSGLKAVTIKGSIPAINNYTFYKCTSLESVIMPESVESIDESAFELCTGLKNINIPGSVKAIGDYAFSECTSLESAAISDGVNEIGYGAFLCCTELKSVRIPKSVVTIAEEAFGYYYVEDDDIIKKTDGFTVICYKGSAGEKYAQDNGFKCAYISGKVNPAYSVSVSGNKATFNWTAVPDAEKYGVACCIGGKWQLVAQGTETSYVMKNLTPGTELKAAVIAKFGGEWNMDYSNAVTVKIPSAYPAVSYEVSGRQFRLKWTAVPGAEKYGLAVYQPGGWKVKAQVNGNVRTYTSPKISRGTYKMVVCAKTGGQWDTGNLNNRAFTITIK